MKKDTSKQLSTIQLVLASSVIASLISGIFSCCIVLYTNNESKKTSTNVLRYENLQDVLEKLITVESPNFEILQKGTDAEILMELYDYEKTIEVLYDKAKLLMSKESLDKLSYYEFGKFGINGLENAEEIYQVHFPIESVIDYYYQCKQFEFDFKDCIQEDIRTSFELD